MKNSLFLYLLLVCCNVALAQESESLSDTEDVYEADAHAPKFQGGGFEKFYEFIKQEFDLKKSAPGKMIVSFTVTAAGELTNIRVLQYTNVDAAAELIRVVKLSPKWESAKRNGKPFSTVVKIPVNFKSR